MKKKDKNNTLKMKKMIHLLMQSSSLIVIREIQFNKISKHCKSNESLRSKSFKSFKSKTKKVN